ncbi:hypothetical protein [Hymenobacter terrenus]|uniref:hypothetical protein n=1 Tax=Hymenobacter terrenus TaxID=1629124 RepID=UPI0006195FA0|nr:hypothetical protein [Hymenobacter terrenus]
MHVKTTLPKAAQKLLQTDHRHPRKLQVLEYLKVRVVGDEVIGAGRKGDVRGFVVVGGGLNELPFVVSFLE